MNIRCVVLAISTVALAGTTWANDEIPPLTPAVESALVGEAADSILPVSGCPTFACDGNYGSGTCCDTASCDGECCRTEGLLGGLIKPSDRCFDDFISPMINFVFFEDPRTLTELRPIFVNHWVPNALGGGDVQLYAVEFRAAVTDRLSIIGVKDGYIVDNTGAPLDDLLDDGWASVTAGLKYNLIRDTEQGLLASAGVTYEIPIGSQRALQDIGDGEFHMFLTGGKRLMDGDAHLLSSIGYRLPADTSIQTTAIHWSNHLDFRLTKCVYVFTEVAWWHWVDDASSGSPLGVAGQDLFNLPANNVTGNDLVTQNVGLKVKPNRATEIGVAYEFPLTSDKDIIASRLMVDLILRY